MVAREKLEGNSDLPLVLEGHPEVFYTMPASPVCGGVKTASIRFEQWQIGAFTGLSLKGVDLRTQSIGSTLMRDLARGLLYKRVRSLVLRLHQYSSQSLVRLSLSG